MNLKSKAPLLIFLISITLGGGFILFSALASESASPAPEQVVKTVVEAPVEREFGLSLDSFNVIAGNIKRNEFLSNILQRYHINLSEISIIYDKAKSVFDVRKIAAGHPYAIITPRNSDSLARAAYFV